MTCLLLHRREGNHSRMDITPQGLFSSVPVIVPQRSLKPAQPPFLPLIASWSCSSSFDVHHMLLLARAFSSWEWPGVCRCSRHKRQASSSTISLPTLVCPRSVHKAMRAWAAYQTPRPPAPPRADMLPCAVLSIESKALCLLHATPPLRPFLPGPCSPACRLPWTASTPFSARCRSWRGMLWTRWAAHVMHGVGVMHLGNTPLQWKRICSPARWRLLGHALVACTSSL